MVFALLLLVDISVSADEGELPVLLIPSATRRPVPRSSGTLPQPSVLPLLQQWTSGRSSEVVTRNIPSLACSELNFADMVHETNHIARLLRAALVGSRVDTDVRHPVIDISLASLHRLATVHAIARRRRTATVSAILTAASAIPSLACPDQRSALLVSSTP